MKILIKSPKDNWEVLSALPFYQKVEELYKGCEISLIENDQTRKLFEFLDLPIMHYHLPERLNHFLGVHKFSVNENNLFNIDIYFDLENTMVSSYLGRCFKARERFGFDRGIKSLFTNKKVTPPEGQDLDFQFLHLLEKARGETLKETGLKVRELTPTQETLFKTQVPQEALLAIINLSDDAEVDFWLRFFQEMPRCKVMVVETSSSPRLDRFYESLGERKTDFVFDKTPGPARIKSLASTALGVLTNDLLLSYALTLIGVRSHYLGVDQPPHSLTSFPLHPHFFERENKEMSQLVDELLIYLKI